MPRFNPQVRDKPKTIKLELMATQLSAQHLWGIVGEVKYITISISHWLASWVKLAQYKEEYLYN